MFLLLACAPPPVHDDTAASDPTHLRGLLPFDVRHNLEDDTCLADGDCYLTTERTSDVAQWVDLLAEDATRPVLHWDRGIPWSSFAVAPPAGTDPVAFYSTRLDPVLVATLDAYATGFDATGNGYLALSLLSGTRASLAPELDPEGRQTDLAVACPDLGPDARFTTLDGTDFALGPTWINFVSFMAERLHPSEIALLVEANLFKVNCPGQWPSLVATYEATYSEVRAAQGADIQLFATLVLPSLLGFEGSCVPELNWVACDEDPPEPPVVDPEACYPGDPSALDDLAAGGHLDRLALSIYPDGLGLALPGVTDARYRVWFGDTTGDCDVQARLPAWVDPLAALDTLGWSGPVSLAETSARDCAIPYWFDDGTTQAVFELPADPSAADGWMDSILAHPDRFDGIHWSFRGDYDPLGLWLVDEGVLDPYTVNLFNSWACSGLYTTDGAAKPLRDRWRQGFTR